MTGAVESVLGIEPWQSVETFLGGLPGGTVRRRAPASCRARCSLLDAATGLYWRGAGGYR